MSKNRFKLAVWSALFLIGVTAAIPSYTQNNQETRFDSTWKLEVYEARKGEEPKLLGRTPTTDGAGVLIPAGVDWYVEPLINKNWTDKDFSALVAELKQRSILGLNLSDSGNIPDAWLAHLKELKGLTKLDLGYTGITDAEMKELRSALPKCEISCEFSPP
jgi:hypothetical protein